jgi:hypothetical protein
VISIFASFLLVTSVYATVFKPQAIEQQIRESDGVFLGHFLKKKTVELEDGSLATQMVFKINQEFGLQSDFYGMDEVLIHYPGGSLADRQVKIEGVPKFSTGEKVVLFIKSIDNRYWGMNLGFGTFKVINYGKETVLVNYIFPHHPEVGQVKFQHFEKALKSIKGLGLKIVQNMQYPSNSPKMAQTNRAPASGSFVEGQNRSVASIRDQSENHEEQSKVNIFWMILTMGVIGGLFRIARQKRVK